MSVVIETTIGDVTVDLFIKERPKACLNFLKLCKLKYYNFNLFHTVEQGFIAQTGDPTGDGDKGESVWGVIEGPKKKFFEAELMPKILHSDAGLLSMVSTGDNFIGSQFFFTLGTELTSLDGSHCVIGEVAEGHEVLRQLNESIVDDKHKPYKDIRITHTVILEDPFADPRGFREPSRSPSPSAERLKNGRIAADEDIDDTQGKTEAEIHEMLQEREAKARATILEIVGDIPDADVAPPENVLFVCKLNPVTTDDDLQIIFSRFGKIKTCEVIRDKSTGDSLQYAFIEFEEQKSCEDAYFKMDNVLIDDRRIHVDFSQSVSKIKWRGKGNYTIHDDDDGFKSEKTFRKKNWDTNASKRRSRSPRRDREFNSRQRSDHRDNRTDHRRYDEKRVNNRNFDSRRSPRRALSPRHHNFSHDRRSRSRGERNRRPKEPLSKSKREASPKARVMSPRRRNEYSPKRNRDASPKRQRNYSPRRNDASNRNRNASPKRSRPDSPRRTGMPPNRQKDFSPRRGRNNSPKGHNFSRQDNPLKRQRDASPRKLREASPKRSPKQRPRSLSQDSTESRELNKSKSSHKHKKLSSKKSKKRSSSSSSGSSSDSQHKNRDKKTRR